MIFDLLDPLVSVIGLLIAAFFGFLGFVLMGSLIRTRRRQAELRNRREKLWGRLEK